MGHIPPLTQSLFRFEYKKPYEWGDEFGYVKH